MIKTGNQNLKQLRDRRTVYIWDRKIDDMKSNSAFEKAAKTVAKLHDIKHENKYKNNLSSEEDGKLFSTWFLKPNDK